MAYFGSLGVQAQDMLEAWDAGADKARANRRLDQQSKISDAQLRQMGVNTDIALEKHPVQMRQLNASADGTELRNDSLGIQLEEDRDVRQRNVDNKDELDREAALEAELGVQTSQSNLLAQPSKHAATMATNSATTATQTGIAAEAKRKANSDKRTAEQRSRKEWLEAEHQQAKAEIESMEQSGLLDEANLNKTNEQKEQVQAAGFRAIKRMYVDYMHGNFKQVARDINDSPYFDMKGVARPVVSNGMFQMIDENGAVVRDGDGDEFSFPVNVLDDFYKDQFTPESMKKSAASTKTQQKDPSKYSEKMVNMARQLVTGRAEPQDGIDITETEREHMALVTERAEALMGKDESMSFSQAVSQSYMETSRRALRLMDYSERDLKTAYAKYVEQANDKGQSPMEESKYYAWLLKLNSQKKPEAETPKGKSFWSRG